MGNTESSRRALLSLPERTAVSWAESVGSFPFPQSSKKGFGGDSHLYSHHLVRWFFRCSKERESISRMRKQGHENQGYVVSPFLIPELRRPTWWGWGGQASCGKHRCRRS